mgnify:CR=1 FL=1|jgi:hypothetical protein
MNFNRWNFKQINSSSIPIFRVFEPEVREQQGDKVIVVRPERVITDVIQVQSYTEPDEALKITESLVRSHNLLPDLAEAIGVAVKALERLGEGSTADVFILKTRLNEIQEALK